VTVATAAGAFALGGELEVHRMGFGAMRITGPGIWGPPEDRDEAIRVLRRAVELGIDLIDTAEAYGPHVSEELIAEALHPYPDGLVIATKGGFDRPGPGRWDENGRPQRLREECEGSLRRLRVERIDLWQLHRIDPDVPADEQFGVMADLRREGKVRFLGLSEVTVEQLELARSTLDVVSVQNRYNLTDRDAEAVLDACEALGIAFIPWWPLAVGRLSTAAGVAAEVAARHNVTPGQVALAWLLHRSPVMLPIPGTSKVAHLEENTAAAELRLSAEDLSALGAVASSSG
jgi:aryl-alcohol dehydrogenase-like predicted oxidoreductase